MIQIFDCEQNSPEWFAARMGIPTASNFAALLAKGEGKTRRTYLLKLAGEVLIQRNNGRVPEGFTNDHLERGHELEPEARDLYSFLTDTEPKRIGFVRNGDKGCSPDSFIGPNGMLEIKTKLPHLLNDVILKDEFPPEHKAQCQGGLWVCEREWIDIAIYWPGLPLFRKRAYRDEAYIANLAAEVNRFNVELLETVEKISSYGSQRMRAAA